MCNGFRLILGPLCLMLRRCSCPLLLMKFLSRGCDSIDFLVPRRLVPVSAAKFMRYSDAGLALS